jgi:uncharacterized damage-inducible protein DinB
MMGVVDRDAIQEFFEYTGWAWDRIGTVLAPRGPEIIAQEMPNSGWPALWDCLRHMSFAYDIWASRLDGRPQVAFDPGPPDWESLNLYHQTARSRLSAYLSRVSDKELHTERDFETIDGVRPYPPSLILWNVLWHDRGHHGDVNTLLYQHGIPDEDWPWLEYRAFINTKRGYAS